MDYKPENNGYNYGYDYRQPKPKKKKAGKIIAICLACVIFAAAAGSGVGVLVASMDGLTVSQVAGQTPVLPGAADPAPVETPEIPPSGIILDTKLHKGFSSFAGELGYMVLDHKFGRKEEGVGDLEQTLSQLIADYRSEQHPVTAAQIRSDLFDCLAKVIVNYICVINPEVVVLRGGVMTSDFLEDLKEKILSYVPERCMPQLMIDASEFSSIKGIVAACRQFISPSLDIVEDGSI